MAESIYPTNGVIAGGISYDDVSNPIVDNVKSKAKEKVSEKLTDKLRNMFRTPFFMENLRSVNWSRAYNWYAELDGVPAPFHRGGALGLPVKNLNFKISDGQSYTFNAGSVDALRVPRAMAELGMVTLSLLDDEQQTLATFFERWYNQVYNPYKGVLPLTEACKQITIYKQVCTRANLKRTYYDIDAKYAKGGLDGKKPSEGYGFDFLVFPDGPLQYSWGTDANDLNTLEVNLQIAHFVNQDFGSPCNNNYASGNKARLNGIASGLTFAATNMLRF